MVSRKGPLHCARQRLSDQQVIDRPQKIEHPQLFAMDANRRIEWSTGIKNNLFDAITHDWKDYLVLFYFIYGPILVRHGATIPLPGGGPQIHRSRLVIDHIVWGLETIISIA